MVLVHWYNQEKLSWCMEEEQEVRRRSTTKMKETIIGEHLNYRISFEVHTNSNEPSSRVEKTRKTGAKTRADGTARRRPRPPKQEPKSSATDVRLSLALVPPRARINPLVFLFFLSSTPTRVYTRPDLWASSRHPHRTKQNEPSRQSTRAQTKIVEAGCRS